MRSNIVLLLISLLPCGVRSTYNAKVLPEELTRSLSGMEHITYNAKVLPEELTRLLSGREHIT